MMRSLSRVTGSLLAAAACGLAGCSTPGSSPESRPACVEFVTPAGDPLWPEIHQWSEDRGVFKKVYSKLRDPREGVVRVQTQPGEQRFKVHLLNESTTGPAFVTVPVRPGMATPVFLHVTNAGGTLFERRDRVIGGNYRGRFGRTTQYSAEQSQLLELKLVAGEPTDYRPGYPSVYPAQTP